MVDATHISFKANDRSYFSLIKKEIHQRASDAGMLKDCINRLDLIVAEMTSNLFKYADGGELLMGVFDHAGSPYVELISIDHGPGMANPSKMMQDGVSSTNTLGHGLGSMKRLSDDFDLYSQVGWGTIVLSRVYNKPDKIKPGKGLVIRPIIVSKPGETTSGDGMGIKQTDTYLKIMLADGLGHGPEANAAVNAAAEAFKQCREFSPAETLRHIHPAIKRTRGAVINIVGYDYATKTWTSAGIGNIAARFLGPATTRNQMSYNGIVGHNIPTTINDQRYAASEYNELILCSDGIKTRWDLSKYPMIHKYDISVLGAAIYKDYGRQSDDMSVVIAKIR